jgi:hypothetical protein
VRDRKFFGIGQSNAHFSKSRQWIGCLFFSGAPPTVASCRHHRLFTAAPLPGGRFCHIQPRSSASRGVRVGIAANRGKADGRGGGWFPGWNRMNRAWLPTMEVSSRRRACASCADRYCPRRFPVVNNSSIYGALARRHYI